MLLILNSFFLHKWSSRSDIRETSKLLSRKKLLDRYVDICNNNDTKTYIRKDFNMDTFPFSYSMNNISIDERNDTYELHSDIDFSNLAA